jgi:hypothetical protein
LHLSVLVVGEIRQGPPTDDGRRSVVVLLNPFEGS